MENKMKINQKIVFKWLGSEYIGQLVEIIDKDGVKIYRIKYDNTIYRCFDGSKFGIVLVDETEKLISGSYVKKIKTERDLMIEELELMFGRLKKLHEENFPKRKRAEFKLLIKDIRKKLMDLQRDVVDEK